MKTKIIKNVILPALCLILILGSCKFRKPLFLISYKNTEHLDSVSKGKSIARIYSYFCLRPSSFGVAYYCETKRFDKSNRLLYKRSTKKLRPYRLDNHLYYEKQVQYDTLGNKLWINRTIIYPFPRGTQRNDTVFFRKFNKAHSNRD